MCSDSLPLSVDPAIDTRTVIGVMDSGVGGLSVLRHLVAQVPQADFMYYADSAYAPYGNTSADKIRARCLWIADHLIAQGAQALVVACNTATAAAISTMRQHYSIPIIGMEPAVKPAAAASKNGIIGVLATTGTLQSAQFAALLENYGQHVRVVTQACVGLVEYIEQGALESPHMQALLRQYCQPLLDAGADTIVLGCTHYPLVSRHIQAIVGAHIPLIDTGIAVARRLHQVLTENGLLKHGFVVNGAGIPGKICFLTSGTAETMQVMRQFWTLLQAQN